MSNSLKNIIISRTDSIGDVILTLPMAGIIKKHFPEIKIGFLATAYTKPVIEASIFVDEFIALEDFMNKRMNVCNEKPEAILHVFPVSSIAKRAKQLQIPFRGGTSHRMYHWFTCNKLISFSRKKSNLHESQLNLKLLEPLGIKDQYSTFEITSFYGLEKLQPPDPRLQELIDPSKYNLILHPKSKGSAREWGLEKYISLIQLLDTERFKIFISGTDKDRELLQPLLHSVKNRVTDITGKMNLEQFISFIKQCNGLIACSTGPLHIAAALGKDAFGIYPPMRPIHPGRWAPLGLHAKVFVTDKECNQCRKSNNCTCISEIQPEEIKKELNKRANLIF